MPKLRALIVDDELPAQSELSYLLDETGAVDVLATASSVRDAIEELKQHRFDVLFLDINMPGVNGMQFAEALSKLQQPPAVVFVTAYGEYAAEAFDVNAIDYLMKPVEEDRLRQAIAKVIAHAGASVKKTEHERIAVEKNGKKALIPMDDISYVMAKDDYSYIHVGKETYLSTMSLTQLEKKFEAHNFYRVHRRYLVNLGRIEEVETVTGGTLLLTLANEEDKIPVSRRRVTMLKKVLGL